MKLSKKKKGTNGSGGARGHGKEHSGEDDEAQLGAAHAPQRGRGVVVGAHQVVLHARGDHVELQCQIRGTKRAVFGGEIHDSFERNKREKGLAVSTKTDTRETMERKVCRYMREIKS